MLVRQAVALFLFSVALLALELSYTKIFSVLLWYHFGFLIVSTAMLGFAVAGVLLAILGERKQRFTLFGLMNGSALASFASYAILLQLDVSRVSMAPSAETLGMTAGVALLLFTPFLFLGLTVSWLITTLQRHIGVIYGANLIGSGMGAVLFLFLFNNFPGEIVPAITATLMVLASLLVVQSRGDFFRWIPIFLVCLLLSFSPNLFELRVANYKVLGRLANPEKSLVYSGWSSLSKVDIFRSPDQETRLRSLGLWGMSHRFIRERHPLPKRLGVVIDANAYTQILKYPQDLGFYDWMTTTFPFHIGRSYEKSLHIGAGGGMDLLAAHHYGTQDVTGVEINPLIVEAVKTKFAGGIYTGGIEGVKVEVAEGRSFLERTDEKYDLIQLSGVDTSASSQAGAFALSENYLYTTGAFVSYLQHLKPGGMLALSRWHLPDRAGQKTYSLRMVNIVREALEQLGIDPEGRVWNFREGPKGFITLLAVQLDPFTPEQIAAGKAAMERNEFTAMIVPGERIGNVYEDFLFSPREQYDALLAAYPYLVAPPTDDRPFIFELQRLASAFRDDDWPARSATITGQEILLVVLAELSILGLLLLVVPTVWLQRRRGLTTPWPARIYFMLIGYAYISVEIVLSQKLVLYLGHPTYALSVVISGMLIFSGIASMISGRLGDRKRFMVILLVPSIAIAGLLLSPALDATLAAPFATRLALTMAFIAPVAFLMGFPFPYGVSKASEESVPLLWAANGFFSVVGSVLAVITSINWGFGAVLLLSTLAYAGAAYLGTRTSFGGERST